MKKLEKIYQVLLVKFGNQNWWPVTSKEKQFEMIVGAILTQNTSWNNVEKSIKILKENNLLNKEAIKNIPEKELALLIKSSGYYNQKAKKLKEFVKFNKEITKDNLLKIWGLGKETVDSILLYAYSQPIFVIDAYTKRIMQRIGYKENNYDDLQSLFMNNLPQDSKLFNEYHALLVKLAKENCKKIPLCNTCPINKECKKLL